MVAYRSLLTALATPCLGYSAVCAPLSKEVSEQVNTRGKTMSKRIAVLAYVAAISLATPLTAAEAAANSNNSNIVTYSLNNFKFIEGASASGTITFNTNFPPIANLGGTGAAFIDSFDITAQAGSGYGNYGVNINYPAFNYNSSNSSAQAIYQISSSPANGLNLSFMDNNFNRVMFFNLIINPSDIGFKSEIPINLLYPLQNQDCLYSCGFRLITSGSLKLVNSAVPEPASWGLMIVGMGGVGSILRRRRNAAALQAAC